jgi:hypothetical protein
VKQILGVKEWPEEKLWQTDLPNLSGVTLPLSNFQVVRAAIIPALIMVLIRPVLLFILALIPLIGTGFGLGIWYVLHR